MSSLWIIILASVGLYIVIFLFAEWLASDGDPLARHFRKQVLDESAIDDWERYE